MKRRHIYVVEPKPFHALLHQPFREMVVGALYYTAISVQVCFLLKVHVFRVFLQGMVNTQLVVNFQIK